jgi:hypothetical protein
MARDDGAVGHTPSEIIVDGGFAFRMTVSETMLSCWRYNDQHRTATPRI